MKEFLCVILFSVLSVVAFGAETCKTCETTTTVVITSGTTAQEDAETMARTGVMRHQGRCRCIEGVGMASTRGGAIRRCCYWGQRVVAEIGVCQSRLTGRWFACVRFK